MDDHPETRGFLGRISLLVVGGLFFWFLRGIQCLSDEESVEFDSIVSGCIAQGSVEGRGIQRRIRELRFGGIFDEFAVCGLVQTGDASSARGGWRCARFEI